VWKPQRRMQGDIRQSLSDTGVRQARLLAQRMKDFHSLRSISSDFRTRPHPRAASPMVNAPRIESSAAPARAPFRGVRGLTGRKCRWQYPEAYDASKSAIRTTRDRGESGAGRSPATGALAFLTEISERHGRELVVSITRTCSCSTSPTHRAQSSSI